MNQKLSSILSGLVLILAGVFFLVTQAGHIDNRNPQFWINVFAGCAIFFLVIYLLNGLRAWGWLFPTFSSAALALTVYLATNGVHSSMVGSPILLSIALPFIVGFVVDRQKNWWALIPAWNMTIISLVTFVADRVQGEVIGAMVLFSIAVPFLVAFMLDRSRTWALIPTYVFTIIGCTPLLTVVHARGEFIGSFFMLAIGLPFFIAYFWSSRNWWAIIPAGIMTTIGLTVLLIGMTHISDQQGPFVNGVIMTGWAATFAIVWLRRNLHPADWAKYPALILAAIALLSFLNSIGLPVMWPWVLIAAGILLLAFSMRRRNIHVG